MLPGCASASASMAFSAAPCGPTAQAALEGFAVPGRARVTLAMAPTNSARSFAFCVNNRVHRVRWRHNTKAIRH